MAKATSSRNGNLDRLENEVSEVTALMKDNVEKVLERGERIDTLQSRSEDLESNSIRFKRSSSKLRKNMCLRNCRMNCIIALVVLGIIAVIVVIVLVETKPWNSSGGDSPAKPTILPVTTTLRSTLSTLSSTTKKN